MPVTTTRTCDRCNKELEENQVYEFFFNQEEYRYIFCKHCVEIAKKMWFHFMNQKPDIPEDFVEKRLKYNTLERIGDKRLPPANNTLAGTGGIIGHITQNTAEPEPKKPNAFARLFYWMFYKDVKLDDRV